MAERPILFSAAMVTALLAGAKTQTRRIAKLPKQPTARGQWEPITLGGPGVFDSRRRPVPPYAGLAHSQTGAVITARFDAGDRLWVRETWRSWDQHCTEDHADDETCHLHCEQTYVAYAATPRVGFRPKPDRARITYLHESSPIDSDQRLLGPWKPSIFMPRWASRLALDVTGVRAERLQDISEADAKAEGAARRIADGGDLAGAFAICATPVNYRAHFRELWESMNGPESWSSNPWVWVVSFRGALGG